MRSAFFLRPLVTVVLTSLLLGGSQAVWADNLNCGGSERRADGATYNSDADLPNFHRVAYGISRSGQPSYAGLAQLAKKGYKTVVDLRMESDQVNQESQWASQLGMKFVPIPMDQLHEPSFTAVQTFIATLKDPDNQPVLVHCAGGDDRTGAMVAFYRLQEQQWAAAKAYKEMLKYGFHPMFTALSDSVFDYQQEKALVAGKQLDSDRPAEKGKTRFDSNQSRLGSRLDLIPM